MTNQAKLREEIQSIAMQAFADHVGGKPFPANQVADEVIALFRQTLLDALPKGKDLKKKFNKMYANIPLGLREYEIVAVVRGKNLTYAEIYRLIKQGETADEALRKMELLKIL